MAGRTATITVLFTDVVGSTARLAELGETRGRAVFDAHHRLLSEAVRRHGGDEAKWLGDGLMAVFTSVADAVRCAVDVQRRAAAVPAGSHLEVRAGLALGEATRDGDDWFGTPVVTASRLCAAAGGGEILCPEVVATLLGGFDDLAFVERGPLALKGLPKPIPTCEVRYERRAAAPDRGPLVGRADELTALTDRLASAVAGRGGLALVVGEPGIGKTRLAEEVVDEARRAGAGVAWGACLEEPGAPPLWPWLQALRELAVGGDGEVAAAVGPQAWAALVEVLPELDPTGDVAPPPLVDADAARFRLFDAIARLVEVLAGRQASVIVLDDLHWADATTLKLLEHLGPRLATSAALVLGTYRDVEVHRGHPLASTLGVLARCDGVTRHALGGLDDAGVAELVRELGATSTPDEVAAVCERSDGNPFFVTELVRLLDGGELASVPEGVRDVVGRRLDHLSHDTNAVLSVAALVGRDADVALLAACVDLTEEAVLDALDEALGAGLLTDRAVAPGGVRFSHALIRETLVDELSTPRRMRLHRRIAAALRDPRPDELAHHLLEGASPGDVGRAVEAAMAAADEALARYGLEEADAWYDRALQAVAVAEPADDRLRADLLVRRGDVLRRAGRVEAALAAFQEAAALAESHGWAEPLAGAALGLAGPPEDTSMAEVDAITPLDRAVEVLDGAGVDPLRAMVLARHAVLLVDRGDPEGRRRLDEALAVARRCSDPRALAYAFRAWLRATLDPRLVDQRTAAAHELLDLGRSLGDLDIETWGHRWLVICLMETGDLAAYDRELDELERLATVLRQPFHEWGWVVRRGGRALMDGRVADAASLADRAMALATEMGTAYTFAATSGLVLAVHLWQGRLPELAPILDAMAETYPPQRPLAAFVHALAGDADAAARHVAASDLSTLGLGAAGLYGLGAAALAEAAALLDDRSAAEQALALLRPLEGRMAVSPPGIVVVMPVDHALGSAMSVLGRHGDAAALLEGALAQERSMGTHGLVPFTQLALARVLRRAGEPDAARALAAEASDAATAMGAPGIAALARF